MNRAEVIAAINTKIQEVYTIATEQYHITFDDVKVEFNMRGRTAGKAKRDRLCFNVEIATLNFEVFCNEVVPHEIAHVVCKRSPSLGHDHNVGWKRVCLSLGGSGSARHSMECNYAYESFLYRSTNGKEVKLSKVRHNRVQRGTEYHFCGGGLIKADGWIRSGVKSAPVPVETTHQLIDTINGWDSLPQLTEVHKILKLSGAQLVAAKNFIATLTNGSRTVNILTNGQREYIQ